MELIDLPLSSLREAPWNPNIMGPDILPKLRESITRYGVVENLVVRPLGEVYEVLSGNQRLKVYREMGLETAPCVVVELDDARAKLLAQALNRTRGEDDLGLKAELVRSLLEDLPQEEVLALLPETASSLHALASLGRESLAEHLRAWEAAQKARLHHLAFQLTEAQLTVVEQALEKVMPQAKAQKGESPNLRGTALYLLGKAYLPGGRRCIGRATP